MNTLYSCKSLVLLTALMLGLAGCKGQGDVGNLPGNHGHSQPVDDGNSVSINGNVAKGPMANATVELFNVDSAGSKNGAAIANTTTDEFGNWTVSVPANSSLLLIEAGGGSYVDESDPEPDMAKKRRITLGAADILEGVLFPGQTATTITAISAALVENARAEAAQLGGFETALNEIKSRAVAAYGFDPFTVKPADPLAPSAGASMDEKKYAMVLGGMAYAMNNAAIQMGKSMMDYTIIQAMARDLANCRIDGKDANGQIDVMVDGVPVPLPTDIILDTEIRRFLNNNYKVYENVPIVSVDHASLCQAVPVAGGDSITTSEDTIVSINVLANDYDPNGGIVTLTSVDALTSAGGAVAFTADGNVTYTPAQDYNGSDTVNYTVADDNGGTATGTLVVTVTPVNDVPVVMGEDLVTSEDVSVITPVLLANESDVDGDTLTISAIDSVTATGAVIVDNLDGTYTYVPTANYFGVDSFAYTVSDGNGGSVGGTVNVVVNSINDNPVGLADSYSTHQDLVLVTGNVLSNDSDVDGDTLSVASVGATVVAGALVSNNGDGTLTYTPAPGYSGGDSFQYTLSDGKGGSVPVTVTVTVYADTDGDGLFDDEEALAGTDINLVDSDGDGFSDGHEVAAGTDPMFGGDKPTGTEISLANNNYNIIADTIWDLAGSPYWIKDTTVTINAGFTLTVEAGVAVKFGPGVDMVVNGGLNVKGRSVDPQKVIFTSVEDLTVQGSIGSFTGTPAAGDWPGLRFQAGSSSGQFSNANISYAGIGLTIQDTSVGTTLSNVLINTSAANGLVIKTTGAGQIASPVLTDIQVVGTASNTGIDINAFAGSTVAPQLSGSNNKVSGVPVGRTAIEVRGDADALIEAFTVTGSSYGVKVSGNASAQLKNNTIRAAATSGILANTMGSLAIKANRIVNNGSNSSFGGGIELTMADAGAVIEHNLIRGNLATDGGGIYIGSGFSSLGSSNVLMISNNLIIQNEATLTGGGVSQVWTGNTNPLACMMQHNTFSENVVVSPGQGGGLYIDSAAFVSLYDNVFWGNVYDVGGDTDLLESGTTFRDYNVWGDAVVTPSGNGYYESVSPYEANWYLKNTSQGVNTGKQASLPTYLSGLAAPTTDITGLVDGSGPDQIDMGYHHDGAAPAPADDVNTLVLPGYSFGSTALATETVTVTPKDSSGNLLGAGLDVDVSVVGLGTLNSVKDQGDGSYQISYTNGSTPTTDSLTISVNGSALATTVNITY